MKRSKAGNDDYDMFSDTASVTPSIYDKTGPFSPSGSYLNLEFRPSVTSFFSNGGPEGSGNAAVNAALIQPVLTDSNGQKVFITNNGMLVPLSVFGAEALDIPARNLRIDINSLGKAVLVDASCAEVVNIADSDAITAEAQLYEDGSRPKASRAEYLVARSEHAKTIPYGTVQPVMDSDDYGAVFISETGALVPISVFAASDTKLKQAVSRLEVGMSKNGEYGLFNSSTNEMIAEVITKQVRTAQQSLHARLMSKNARADNGIYEGINESAGNSQTALTDRHGQNVFITTNGMLAPVGVFGPDAKMVPASNLLVDKTSTGKAVLVDVVRSEVMSVATVDSINAAAERYQNDDKNKPSHTEYVSALYSHSKKITYSAVQPALYSGTEGVFVSHSGKVVPLSVFATSLSPIPEKVGSLEVGRSEPGDYGLFDGDTGTLRSVVTKNELHAYLAHQAIPSSHPARQTPVNVHIQAVYRDLGGQYAFTDNDGNVAPASVFGVLISDNNATDFAVVSTFGNAYALFDAQERKMVASATRRSVERSAVTRSEQLKVTEEDGSQYMTAIVVVGEDGRRALKTSTGAAVPCSAFTEVEEFSADLSDESVYSVTVGTNGKIAVFGPGNGAILGVATNKRYAHTLASNAARSHSSNVTMAEAEPVYSIYEATGTALQTMPATARSSNVARATNESMYHAKAFDASDGAELAHAGGEIAGAPLGTKSARSHISHVMTATNESIYLAKEFAVLGADDSTYDGIEATELALQTMRASANVVGTKRAVKSSGSRQLSKASSAAAESDYGLADALILQTMAADFKQMGKATEIETSDGDTYEVVPVTGRTDVTASTAEGIYVLH